MSIQDKFDQIIEENISLLIKSITKFKEKDDNFRICKQFITSKLKHHNFLSVNSHEIRKRINGFLERLRIANYEKVAVLFETVSESLINNPICVQHHQTDIQWWILNLLLEVSYNPVGELTRNLINNRAKYDALFKDWPRVIIDKELAICEFSRDTTVVPVHKHSFSSSDLSEWSDSDNENEDEFIDYTNHSKSEDVSLKNDLNSGNEKWKIVTYLSPPKKIPHYKEFDSSSSFNWIAQNVQYSWWNDSHYVCPSKTTYMNARFCSVWNEFLLRNSLDFTPKTTSQVSEYCAYREILWMFIAPGDYKFFKIVKDCVIVKNDVSIPSTSEAGFKYFQNSFADYMTYMNVLRTFCRDIFKQNATDRLPPKTYLDYAFCINEFLQPIYNLLIEKERQITNLDSEVNRTDVNPFSLIKLFQDLKESFTMLKNLYNIHTAVVLDYTKFPAYICSTYLLAKLYSMLRENRTNHKEGNLIFVIFLKSFRLFITTIDKWLMYGNLEYGYNEFLIEKDLNVSSFNQTEYKSRQFSKCKDQLFYVPTTVSNEIVNSELINLLLKSLLNTSPNVEMLNKLDRLGDLRVNHLNQMLMQDMNVLFWESIMEEIEKYKLQTDVTETETELSSIEEEVMEVNKNGFCRNNFENRVKTIGGDEFLLAAFAKTLNSIDEISECRSYMRLTNDSVELYNRLNKSLTLLTPHTLIISTALKGILKKKLVVISQYLTNIYKEELQIVKHLRNLRQVLLMEAGDLMCDFYTRLFQEIENGANWANPYRLTVQLYAALCSRLPNILFSVHVNSTASERNGKVLSSVNFIRLNYDVPRDLQCIISTDNLNLYNKIFNLILKIKWAITTIETLKHKQNRVPYSKLEAFDIISRRLFMLKMWLMYSIQSVHNYLYGVVIEIYSKNLDQKIENASSLTEIIDIHKAFITKICDLCFLSSTMNPILTGILQLLELVYVLKLNWETLDSNTEFIDMKAIDDIEQTYICCHQYLVDSLNKAAYKDSNIHLITLADAFSCSVPY